jgi:hypothetical protein
VSENTISVTPSVLYPNKEGGMARFQKFEIALKTLNAPDIKMARVICVLQ